MLTKAPLNGTKTHPLSKTAMANLREVARAEHPAQEFNPGVVNRLLRENLVEVVFLPSPYAIHIGKRVNIQFLRITEAGRAALQSQEKNNG